MDIFSLDRTSYMNGRLINNIESCLWIERYLEGGEFTITGDPTPQFRSDLAVGTLLSHVDTKEVMIVTSHEIDESKDDEVKLVIKGISVEKYMMLNRFITMGSTFGLNDPTSDAPHEFTLLSNMLWIQAVILMEDFLESSIMGTAENFPNLNVTTTLSGGGFPQERVVKRGVLYPEVIRLLKSGDYGIKVVRPTVAGDTTLDLIVHAGADLRTSVQFTWIGGDVEKARYYWSIDKDKNSAYVVAKYYGLRIRPSGVTGWDLRVMGVDASDWETKYVEPSGLELARIDAILTARGNEGLSDNNKAEIIDATISPNSRWVYRRDYNVGDIVYVIGNHGVSAPMRVTEFAENMDESGESGYPTLSVLES